MNIDIEDNVPMPDEPPAEFMRVAKKLAAAGISPYDPIDLNAKCCGICGAIIEADELTGTRCKCSLSFNPPQPGPYDCTFVGGPLNGKFGPLRGNDKKVVEIEIYNADGSVASVELYALGDTHPTPTFRYHVGSKEP